LSPKLGVIYYKKINRKSTNTMIKTDIKNNMPDLVAIDKKNI